MISERRYYDDMAEAPAAAGAIIDVRLVDHPVRPIDFEPFPQPAGGECIFLGRTREERHPRHGPLLRLSYQAYHPMAEAVLRRLAQQSIEDYGCLAVRIHHAIGMVPPGEASVMIQVVCAHRSAAFVACQFLIDR